MKINITTIGWGTGTFNVLYGLKKNPKYNLAAIVSVSDSGGSTGEIRDQFGILPPGDIRRAIAALSEDTGIVRKLFEYRFKAGNRMAGHTIGNLLLTALADITGDFEKGIEELGELFDMKGKVIPVTLDDIQLGITLENGTQIIGETNIDIPKHDANLGIRDAFLVGGGKLNPRAREAILNSDYLIIGPGDLYTSIVPNLLIDGIREAIHESNAKVLYICNVMTKHGETNNFEVEDFVRVIEKYIGEHTINYVLVNNAPIWEWLIERYRKYENKQPVQITDLSKFADKSYKIVERDVVSEDDFIRHDPKKLTNVINDFVEGWIK